MDEQNGSAVVATDEAGARLLERVGVSAETANQFLTVLRVMSDRANLARQAGMQFGGNRDLWEQYGYKSDLEFEDYMARYDREGLSGRIVDKPPKDTWRTTPVILDGKATDTPFVEGLDALAKRTRLWSALLNVDRVSGIGEYGVLLIGTAGSENYEEPQAPLSGPEAVLYFRPFDEDSAEIQSFVMDAASARFGRPETYKLDLGEVDGRQLPDFVAHWSRVIHVAEDSLDTVTGRPRMKRSFNRLVDLDKIVGAAAEAFWRLVIKMLILEERDDADIRENMAELEEETLALVHGLKRVGVFSGVNLREVGQSESPKPGEAFDIAIAMIAADIEMPRNILIGTQEGVRASDVDAATWAGTITSRQTNHAEPVILRPAIDWLIAFNAIPEPTSGGYDVVWAPPFAETVTEKLEQAKIRSEILGQAARDGTLDFGLATPDEVRELALFEALEDGSGGETITETIAREEAGAGAAADGRSA